MYDYAIEKVAQGITTVEEIVRTIPVPARFDNIETATGNPPTGGLLEFWVYLISAALLPPLAAFWALIDRNRWSTVVIGVACFAVAVMLYRMLQIWFVQVA